MTIERQLYEALRQLRKSTGMDWEKTIALRAKFLDEGGKREVCPSCKGAGLLPLDRWTRADGCLPDECRACNGQGEVYIP